jgi:hypothetical protein
MHAKIAEDRVRKQTVCCRVTIETRNESQTVETQFETLRMYHLADW